MITPERMKITIEVLKALSELNLDLAGDHKAGGDEDLVNKCFEDAVLLERAIGAVVVHNIIGANDERI